MTASARPVEGQADSQSDVLPTSLLMARMTELTDAVRALEIGLDRVANYAQGFASEGPVCNAALNPDRIRGLLLQVAAGRPVTDHGDRRVLQVFADQIPLLLQRAGDWKPDA